MDQALNQVSRHVTNVGELTSIHIDTLTCLYGEGLLNGIHRLDIAVRMQDLEQGKDPVDHGVVQPE